MTTSRCPNYGRCLPIQGLACEWTEGCTIYRLEQRLDNLCEDNKIHTKLHEEQNGDVKEIVEWVRWAKRTALAARMLAGFIVIVGIVGGGITVVVRFLGA